MCDGDGDISRSALERLVEAIRVVRARPIPEVPDAMRTELVGLRSAIDLLEVQFSLVASAFASTDEGEWQGYVSPIQWMRVECGMTAGAAWKAVCVGDQAPALPLSLEAVEAGPLGFAHLAMLAGTARALSESPTSVTFDERPLLEHALAHDLKRFRDDCAHVRHVHDAAAFRAEQAENESYRSLEVRTEESGAVYTEGWFDPVGGCTVRMALDRLARRCGSADRRNRNQRYADALVELAQHALDAGKLPKSGGQAPHLQVTTTVDTLRAMRGAPAGMLEGVGPISASTVQRLACDANITRVVMGPDSAVLDVGRTHRLPSLTTRRALRTRDRGCQWPGCDREAAWTAAHHLVHWANGGATEIENLVLLCHRHHRLVHEGGWTLARGEDGALVAVAPVPDVAARARAPDVPPV
jgi:Domain of unknown function (DUF222)/HNH endonuclease